MYFSKQFYKIGLALPAKHGFNFPPDLSFQFTYSSMILPGSSSPSHREGPGTEVDELLDNTLSNPPFLLASKMEAEMREATCVAPLTS